MAEWQQTTAKEQVGPASGEEVGDSKSHALLQGIPSNGAN